MDKQEFLQQLRPYISSVDMRSGYRVIHASAPLALVWQYPYYAYFKISEVAIIEMAEPAQVYADVDYVVTEEEWIAFSLYVDTKGIGVS